MDGGHIGDREEAARRRFLYRDVEELITSGFLSHPVPFNGHRIVIRSLNRSELALLNLRADHAYAWRRWALASAIVGIDGWVLHTDENTPAVLYHYWLKDLHRVFVDALMYVFLGLQRRVQRANKKVEAYCYEPYSRLAWKTGQHKTALSRNALTESWSAFMDTLDSREKFSQDWDRSSSIVSATSNKGGKAVRKHLDKVRDRHREQAVQAIEEMVNFVIQGTKEDPGATIMVRGQPMRIERIKQARTVTEMEAEMEAVMAGEKDGHDLQVEDYEKAVRDSVARRKAKAEERRAAQREMGALMEQAGIGGSTQLVGYSKRQLDQIGGKPVASGVKTTPTASSAQRLYQRYLQNPVGVGQLNARGVPEARESGSDGVSLQDKIASRKPAFGAEAMTTDSVRKSDGDQ